MGRLIFTEGGAKGEEEAARDRRRTAEREDGIGEERGANRGGSGWCRVESTLRGFKEEEMGRGSKGFFGYR